MKKIYFLILLCIVCLEINAQKFVEDIRFPGSGSVFVGGVSVSGSCAIIGAYQDPSGSDYDAGAAYVFEKDSAGIWVKKQKLLPSIREKSAWFGESVSVSGNYAVIGAPHSSAGAIFIFERDSAGVWFEKARFFGRGLTGQDLLGWSVGISGNYIVAGAEFDDYDENGANGLNNDPGSAYFYERDSTGTWQFKQIVVASDRAPYGSFGQSACISGNNALIGSPGDFGKVYSFVRDTSGKWIEKQKILSADSTRIGSSLSIYDSTFVVGTNRGFAYVFEKKSGIWVEKQKLISSDGDPGNLFGYTLSIYRDHIVIGDRNESEDVSGGDKIYSAGAAYIFSLDGTGKWLQKQKLVTSKRSFNGRFSYSIAIANNLVIGLDNGDAYFFSACDSCPNIIVDPTNENICIGDTVSFQTLASGDSLSYQWQADQGSGFINLNNDTNYAGVYDSLLLVSGTNLTMNGYKYRCIVSGKYGPSAFTNSVNLGVYSPLSISSQPVDTAICAGNIANFNVIATGLSLTYQWQINEGSGFNNIVDTSVYNGIKSPQLLIQCDSSMTNFQYRCLLSAACSSDTISKIVTLFVNPVYVKKFQSVICNGDSVFLGKKNRTISGTYNDTLQTVYGCDSILITQLTVLPANTFSQSITINSGDSLIVGTHTYTTSATYNDVLTSLVNGCDSAITTNLTVLPAGSYSQSVTLCSGQNIKVGVHIYSTNGTYKDTLSSYNGSDSIVNSFLTVLPVNMFSQSITLCSGQSISVGKSIYYSKGTFTDTLTSFKGCDSTVTTQLTVLSSITKTQSLTICSGQSITVGSNVYSTTGTFTDVLTSQTGCDSTVTTSLTVSDPKVGANTNHSTICAGESVILTGTGATSYSWSNGITNGASFSLNSTTTFTVTGTFNLCVSKATITIAVNDVPNVGSIAAPSDTVCLGSSVTLSGTGASTYTWTGGVIDRSSFNPIITQTYTVTGTDIHGCKNSATRLITICNSVGVNEIDPNKISIYPNPNNGVFRIEIKDLQISKVLLYNLNGQIIYESKGQNLNIDLSLQPIGTYFLEIISPNKIYKDKIVIQ